MPAANSQATQTSKENTPMPGTQDTSSSGKPPLASKLTSDHEYESLQVLAESYGFALRYGKEYMDENPLVGEPGAFILSKSREPVAATVPQVLPKAAPKAPTVSKRPLAPEIKTANLNTSARKGSKGADKSPISPATKDKKARRKSKAVNGGTAAETNPSVNNANTPN